MNAQNFSLMLMIIYCTYGFQLDKFCDKKENTIACNSDTHKDIEPEQCIDKRLLCNGENDCDNGYDESVKLCGCPVGMFECDNRTCIPDHKRCDLREDCQKGEDEQDCELYECPPSHVKCANHGCLESQLLCDFTDDCGDNSDEEYCDYRGCYETEFQCANQQCIPMYQLCDGERHCKDGSDENQCDSSKVFVKCEIGFYSSLRCDGWLDCAFGIADELGCTCRPDQFVCNNTRCIEHGNVCDTVCDCGASCEDERDCELSLEQKFICQDDQLIARDWDHHRLIDNAYVCDGINNCLNNAHGLDEEGCRAKLNNSDDTTLHSTCFKSCDNISAPCNPEIDKQCVYDSTGKHCDILTIPGDSAICDGRLDCASRQDELHCDSRKCPKGLYRCKIITQCIREELICDGHVDCEDMSDETMCANSICSKHQYRCKTGQCIQEHERCDFIRQCLDGSDEHDCAIPDVCEKGYFRCLNGQCIDENIVCVMGATGYGGCQDNSHLLNCSTHRCGHDQFKCHKSYCIPKDFVCNGKPDCKPTMSDEGEANCEEPCPYGSHICRCKGQSMNCENRNLTYIPDTSHDMGIYQQYQLSGNKLGKVLSNDTFDRHTRITYLDLSKNDINIIEQQTFVLLIQLQTLNLNFNNLSKLAERTFIGLYNMKTLYITGNGLRNIEPQAFLGLSSLKTLNLSHQELTELHKNAFIGLSNISLLNLAHNKINNIEGGAFNGLYSLSHLYLSHQNLRWLHRNTFAGLANLTVLDVSHNKLQVIEDGSFNGLYSLTHLNLGHNNLRTLGRQTFNGLLALELLDLTHNNIDGLEENTFDGFNFSLKVLKTDEYRFCCLAKYVEQCFPEPDEFSSCEDLMSNYVLRICIWILALSALCGNIMVLIWRICDNRDSKVHSFLISQLAIGDMLMGAYLLIIGSVDTYYRGVYIIFDSRWRASHLCQLAGFLSTFSSELSVFTLTVITMDRFIAIAFPFRTRRLTMNQARLLMFGLWVLAILIGLIPLFGLSYFDGFYGRSGVCLALHITPTKPPGWEYSVAIFLILNLLSFIAIAAAYLWMFVVVSKSRSASRGPEVSDLLQARSEQAMARRMSLIVGTDFCCWVPISILGLSSLGGAHIPPQVYAWVAVFVLPLNSAVNPVLYTISTAAFISQAKHRMFRFRMSFSSSGRGLDTRSTIASFHDDRNAFMERRAFIRHSRSQPLANRNGINPRTFHRSITENGLPSYRNERPMLLKSFSTDCSTNQQNNQFLTRTDFQDKNVRDSQYT